MGSGGSGVIYGIEMAESKKNQIVVGKSKCSFRLQKNY